MWLQTTTGCWWKACTCTHCWCSLSSLSRGFSASISALAGVSWIFHLSSCGCPGRGDHRRACASVLVLPSSSPALYILFLFSIPYLVWAGGCGHSSWVFMAQRLWDTAQTHQTSDKQQDISSQDRLCVDGSSWMWTFLDCPASSS